MYELMNKPFTEMRHLTKKFVMLPQAINGLHLYAYMNKVEDFDNAVEEGINYL